MTRSIGKYPLIPLEKTIHVQDLVTIHYFEYGKDYSFKGESHNFWEFLYVDKGSIYVQADQSHHKLDQGQIIFHHPMEFHTVAANKEVAPNLVVVSFVAESEAMNFFKHKILTLSPDQKNHLGHIIRLAKEVFESPLDDPYLRTYIKKSTPPFASEQLILLNLEQFLIECIRRAQDVLRPPKGLPPMLWDSQTSKVHYIVELLKANLYQDLDLPQISRAVHMSPSALNKLFKQDLQLTVLQHYNQLKIQEAKRLIRQGTYNFTEIAGLLNYQSIHYFSRVFKKHTHMTLSNYKASVKGILDA